MTPRWTSPLTGSAVYEADAREVAATLPPGCASPAILDGPYGKSMGAWDKIPRGGTLGDLYTGHLDDVGRVCAPSASLYLWNTSAGWAELHPLVLARGWTFRSLIVWDKIAGPALYNAGVQWGNTIEVCGFYTVGEVLVTKMPGSLGCVWPAAAAQYADERLKNGQRITSGMYSTDAMHPCQKPLLFAERMIRASSRPGDLVWAPFGGTLRELVAGERIARLEPTEARRVITCEINKDGPDYIGAALEQIGAEVRMKGGQVGLFGAPR